VGEALPVVSGGFVTFRERDFEALARFNDQHGARYFAVGHRRISFTQHVGYVQVGEIGIEVLPKADRRAAGESSYTPWREGLLRMLEVALGVRLEDPGAAAQTTSRSSLLDLVIQRFVAEVETLLHQGLARGYRNEEANGTAFRGRLLVADNLRRNLARPDRFFVRCNVYDRDVPVNQILRAALDAVGTLPLANSLSARAAECRELFPEVGATRSVERVLERLVLGRSTERYREALVMARMILGQYAPHLRAGRIPVFGILFDMNTLWERYVAALFRRAAIPGLLVSTQSSVHFWRAPGEPARRLRPDIVANVGAAPALVVDTKWKTLRHGAPSEDDLKQMFAYNELLGTSNAVLVYPRVGDAAAGVSGSYVNRDHRCHTFHVGLFQNGAWSTRAMQEQVRALLRQYALDASATAAGAT
jgi:5-methylcytosine-specific restriction enzyme subunit McrC